MIEIKNSQWILFPYDFDLSSIIKTSEKEQKSGKAYPISNETILNETKNFYLQKKAALYQRIESLRATDQLDYEQFRNRLDRFYDNGLDQLK